MGRRGVYLLMVNCPRSTFLKRDSLPLVFISLSSAGGKTSSAVGGNCEICKGPRKVDVPGIRDYTGLHQTSVIGSAEPMGILG